ncbi:MAG: hypothetical protein RIF41_18070, partial [Polyangiaceae bacterium]
RKILLALGTWCAGTLRAAGARSPDPHGAFYLFPDLSPLRDRLAARGIVDSEQLCMRLLEETGVAILPGSSFGRPAQEMNVRLAYVDFEGEKALAALDGVAEDAAIGEDFVREHCPHVVEAIERMAEWLQQE